MPLLNPLALMAFSKMLPAPNMDDINKGAQSLSLMPQNDNQTQVKPTQQLDLSSQPKGISTAKVDVSNLSFDQGVADKAQQYIDTHARGRVSPITGIDIAKASQAYNVPPSLMLAQAQIENSFMLDPNARRAKATNNPMSVGLFDDGQNKFKFPDITSGIMAYGKLLNDDYLQNGKVSSDELLKNFVNKNGARYATNKNYETELKSVVSKAQKLGLK